MNQDIKILDFNKIETIPAARRELFQYGNIDYDLLLEYFSLRFNKYRDRFIVESKCIWRMYQKTSPIRILLVKMEEGDIVYCHLKNVTFFASVYTFLMGKPISKSNNQENEERVLFELCRFQHIKGFEGIQEEIDTLKSKDLFKINKPDYVEYYIDTKERFNNYLNKSAWRSKYSINKVKADKDFVFREFQSQDFDKILKLLSQWEVSNNTKAATKIEKESYLDILNHVNTPDSQERYLIYNLLYKEKLIGCIMFLIIQINEEVKVTYQEHNLNLSRYFETKNELHLESGVYKNIGNIMFYLTTEDLIKKGVQYSYCQGIKFYPKKASGQYKERLNDKKINFSKVDSKLYPEQKKRSRKPKVESDIDQATIEVQPIIVNDRKSVESTEVKKRGRKPKSAIPE